MPYALSPLQFNGSIAIAILPRPSATSHSYTMAPSFSLFLLAATFLFPSIQAQTLFPFEQRQLTREYVASLPEEDRQLFAFDEQFDTQTVNADKPCRYNTTDGKWPSEKAWTGLTKQLSSASSLIKTVPQASPCYGPNKDDAKCQDLARNWYNSALHIDDPSEVLSPVYQGLTCQPPSVYDSTNCTLGGYPTYVVSAKSVLDIQLGINFARNNNIRLIIKNTGHDFAGKSVGASSLSIWTHGLKDIQFIDNYVDGSGYKGPAVKAGAGVQAFELYKAANDKGVVVVAGEGQVENPTCTACFSLLIPDRRRHGRLHPRRRPLSAELNIRHGSRPRAQFRSRDRHRRLRDRELNQQPRSLLGAQRRRRLHLRRRNLRHNQSLQRHARRCCVMVIQQHQARRRRVLDRHAGLPRRRQHLRRQRRIHVLDDRPRPVGEGLHVHDETALRAEQDRNRP